MSTSKPKLLFVYDHKYPERWMDGLWAALNLLEEDFEIVRWNFAEKKEDPLVKSDFVLGWGGFNSYVDKWMQTGNEMYNYITGKFDAPHFSLHPEVKKGLCIGGNAFPLTEGYDIYFYETEWVKDYLKLPKNSVHAFGINSELFNKEPLPQVGNLQFATPAIWDYIGVGSLSYWKRWEKMKHKKGNRLVIGEYQVDNEQESARIATDLLRSDIAVSPMVNPVDLANYYRWSRKLYIPADIYGGGERAVLEARACGLEVEVEVDNPKLKELLSSEIWDEKYYAKQLKDAIWKML